MSRRVPGHMLRVPLAVVAVLLSVSLAGAFGRKGDSSPGRSSPVGDITPFGIIPAETARACVVGLPVARDTHVFRWQIRFVDSDGHVVATEQLEVPHAGFKCVELSYDDALTRLATGGAPGPAGRVQLAVQAFPLDAAARELARLVRRSGEVSNVGTLEVIEVSSGQTRTTGRFGLKSYDLSDPTRP